MIDDPDREWKYDELPPIAGTIWLQRHLLTAIVYQYVHVPPDYKDFCLLSGGFSASQVSEAVNFLNKVVIFTDL